MLGAIVFGYSYNATLALGWVWACSFDKVSIDVMFCQIIQLT